jgi:hypothetical protein
LQQIAAFRGDLPFCVNFTHSLEFLWLQPSQTQSNHWLNHLQRVAATCSKSQPVWGLACDSASAFLFVSFVPLV